MKKVLSILFACMMLLSAVGHVFAMDAYAPLIPEFIPATFANIVAAIAELVIGIMLLMPKHRSKGGLLFALLMIAFLPIHIWDMMKENPFIGEPPMPLIRVLIQFLLIYGGYWLFKKYKNVER